MGTVSLKAGSMRRLFGINPKKIVLLDEKTKVCGLWFVVCGLWFVVCGLWSVVWSMVWSVVWSVVYGLVCGLWSGLVCSVLCGLWSELWGAVYGLAYGLVCGLSNVYSSFCQVNEFIYFAFFLFIFRESLAHGSSRS